MHGGQNSVFAVLYGSPNSHVRALEHGRPAETRHGKANVEMNLLDLGPIRGLKKTE